MQQRLCIAVIGKSHVIRLMLRHLSTGLLAAITAFVAPLAATAQEGSAEDLGVMSGFFFCRNAVYAALE
jgi:hypothetical protein